MSRTEPWRTSPQGAAVLRGGWTGVPRLSGPAVASDGRPPMRRRFRFRERLLWLLVVLFLLAQFGMFRQFVMREIARRYPANHDQANFLQQSYLAYEKLLAAGPREGFSEELGNGRPHKAHPPRDTVVLPQHAPEGRQRTDLQTVAVGLMLPFQATILYGIAGPGRVTALSINFFYFALFQIALVATLRRLTGRWSVALIGLGLLLTAMTPFYWQGGIADFRTDFIGFCLFGTFMCLALRCGAFASRRWSVAAGLVAALLVTFRFISLVYLAGILGLL